MSIWGKVHVLSTVLTMFTILSLITDLPHWQVCRFLIIDHSLRLRKKRKKKLLGSDAHPSDDE